MQHSEKLALSSARALRIVSIIAMPAVRVVSFCSDIIVRMFGARVKFTTPIVTEEELKMLVEAGEEEGVFEEEEKDMIDPVSRKFLKTDIVYGKAALDNRLAVDLYRPLQHGVIKGTNGDSQTDDPKRNLEAAKMLVKHLVDLVNPGRDELLYGVIGVPSQATQRNKQAIDPLHKELQ